MARPDISRESALVRDDVRAWQRGDEAGPPTGSASPGATCHPCEASAKPTRSHMSTGGADFALGWAGLARTPNQDMNYESITGAFGHDRQRFLSIGLWLCKSFLSAHR